MNRIKAKDGKENLLQGLEHRTAGRLRARVALSADACDAQMIFLGHHGYRVIAHDRSGHGRWDSRGTEMRRPRMPTTGRPLWKP